jgi:outer membrane immunogenic protein
MKKLLFAGVLALGAIPALAADLPYKAAPMAVAAVNPYSWTGWYLSGNIGGAWDSKCWDLQGGLVWGFNPNVHEGCGNGSGFIGGGAVGYRYQLGAFVFGLEGQADAASLSAKFDSAAVPGAALAITGRPLVLPPGTSISLTNKSALDAIYTFTGQVGYAFGPVLLYAKGGAAVTSNTYDGALLITTPRTSFSAFDRAKDDRFGGVVGAGIDWMFAPNWFVGVDYEHLFMNTQSVGLGLTGTAPPVFAGAVLAPGTPTRLDKIDQSDNLVTVHLGYKF